MTFKEKLQHKYALSEQGAKDMIHAFYKRNDIQYCADVSSWNAVSACQKLHGRNTGRQGNPVRGSCLICLALIGVTTYIQYNATFLSTYVESGVRRYHTGQKNSARSRFHSSERRIFLT